MLLKRRNFSEKLVVALGLVGLFVVVCGSLFITNAFTTKVYLSAILCGLVITCRDVLSGGLFLKGCWGSCQLKIVVAFLLWCIIATLATGNDFLLVGRRALVILTFIFLVAYLSKNHESEVKYVLSASVIVAALLYVYSFFHFYENHGLEARFEGFGLSTIHPLLTGVVSGGMAILAFVLGWEFRKVPVLRYSLFLAATILLVVSIFTWSRTVLVGLAAPFLYLAILNRNPKYIFGVILIAGLCVLAVVMGIGSERLLNASEWLTANNRITTWENVLAGVREHPLFGVGLLDEGKFLGARGAHWEHPHSLYLVALHYSGIVGLFLHVAIYFSPLYWLLRNKMKHGFLEQLVGVMLAYFVVIQMAEVHSYVSRPNYFWFLLWMPIGMFVALMANQKEQATLAVKQGEQ